ncbi:phytoene synthase [Aliigemmobacter aestuarii]|uniref:Phytoene synthase n=1 Tax=Aliigemmobacter aestuarii TaxID=1445661 RepID=A0A4S3MLQ6_9RHOB|nr:squalene/phytoene synthase family protein [Gemmobacter aestuarii]THD83126.1 phytoene synthase [Gemmobacter aestuarii]
MDHDPALAPSPSLVEPLVAPCAALVEKGDPDRFRALMVAPLAARLRLFPLFAFNLEVARAPWASREPMIAEMRLQFWRDVVDEAGQGRARAHEVAAPLAHLIRDHALPLDVLDRLVAARQWDIYRDPFADQAALDAYLEDTGAGLMWAACKALGAPDAAEGAVRAAGWAAGLAGFLRAFPELEARGRVPLVDGRPEAVAALARRGLAAWARAHAGRPPAVCAPALRTAWQTPAILRTAMRDPARVAGDALAPSEFARRWGLLWRAASGGW